MILGGVVACFLAINAERKSLEDIADPLSKAPAAAARSALTADGPIEPSGAELVSGRAGRVRPGDTAGATQPEECTMDLTSPIVVGVSRRTGSPEAVRWAAAEAQLRIHQRAGRHRLARPRAPAAWPVVHRWWAPPRRWTRSPRRSSGSRARLAEPPSAVTST